jgi:purine-binding chemotaxis protein CheW
MSNEKNSYLSFSLANETFALNVKKVLEVLQMQKITKVPQTPDYVRGILNFRGEILPVIDTRLKFNMPAIEDNSRTIIIVLDLVVKSKELKIGAIADAVSDVIEINDTEIKNLPEISSRYNTDFIYGMIRIKEEFIIVLDIDKVFSEEEIFLVKNSTETSGIEIKLNENDNNDE